MECATVLGVYTPRSSGVWGWFWLGRLEFRVRWEYNYDDKGSEGHGYIVAISWLTRLNIFPKPKAWQAFRTFVSRDALQETYRSPNICGALTRENFLRLSCTPTELAVFLNGMWRDIQGAGFLYFYILHRSLYRMMMVDLRSAFIYALEIGVFSLCTCIYEMFGRFWSYVVLSSSRTFSDLDYLSIWEWTIYRSRTG